MRGKPCLGRGWCANGAESCRKFYRRLRPYEFSAFLCRSSRNPISNLCRVSEGCDGPDFNRRRLLCLNDQNSLQISSYSILARFSSIISHFLHSSQLESKFAARMRRELGLEWPEKDMRRWVGRPNRQIFFRSARPMEKFRKAGSSAAFCRLLLAENERSSGCFVL